MELLDDIVMTLRVASTGHRRHQRRRHRGRHVPVPCVRHPARSRDEAYFRAAGINNGLTASELGMSYLLPRAIGSSRAFEIMLSGRDIHAEEAERIGLVSQGHRAADGAARHLL